MTTRPLSIGSGLLLFPLLFAAACAGDGGTILENDVPADAADHAALPDAAADNPLPDAAQDLAPDLADLGSDEAAADLLPAELPDVVLPDAIAQGAAGWPCLNPDDCNEPFCIDTPDGKACSKTCEEECPFDWACTQLASALPDVIFICVPQHMTLCRPCKTNAECVANDVDLGEFCADLGAPGAFCAVPCAEDAPCPDGYLCAATDDVTGTARTGCIPDQGKECGCPKKWVDEAAATQCFTANAAGVCLGERKCTAAGLSPCNALIPAPEDCNSFDDDCDGQTDEQIAPDVCLVKNEFGTCFGEKTCVEGGWACNAKEPGAELCDGLDNNCDDQVDEIYPDSNGDGIADCLTDDADGDGVKDTKDNCPYDPNTNQADNDLDMKGDACDPDDDNDQVADAADCEPFNKNVYPGQEDKCDGLDNDCSGKVDDAHPDTDSDGQADCIDTDDDNDGIPDPADCEPTDPLAAPGLPELCNGKDENCNGQVDEGYPDFDGDGEADCIDADFDGDAVLDAGDNCPFDANPGQQDSDADGTGDACDPDDDGDFVADLNDNCPAKFNPFQDDTDKDGKGDACDVDDDGDGVPDAADNCPLAANPGQEDPDGDLLGNACDVDDDGDGDPDVSDCLPLDPAAAHGKQEACNEKDDDCDGATDEAGAIGCEIWFADVDNDGYGNQNTSACLCGPDYLFTATVSGDCDDSASAIHPGAKEVCNGKDDNCDGLADPANATGCTQWYKDADGDGYGDPATANCQCAATPAFPASKAGDCNDKNAAIHPFAAEVCNTLDDDCDKVIDPPLIPGCETWYADADGDGWGNPAKKMCLCAPDDMYNVEQKGDCDDVDPDVNPVATESCNGKDDNCDGKLDPPLSDGCTLYYKDADGDGYGFTPASMCLCGPGMGYVTPAYGDCNDVLADVHPGAAELCNGEDDDCDYKVDEGFPGVGLPCDGGDADLCKMGTTTCKDDGTGIECVNETVSHVELCNGVDDDCDGVADEEFTDTDLDGTADCVDGDDDGDLVPDVLDNCPLAPNNGQEDFDLDAKGDACDPDDDNDLTPDDADCGPLDPEIHPGATELCNAVDDDCNGQTDETFATLGAACDGTDSDQCQKGTFTCQPGGLGVECVNESVKNIPETCGNGDEDCDATTDEENAVNCKTYYVDADGDGYGINSSKCLCKGNAPYTATVAGDCNDGNASIKPGIAEVCGNAVDDNCNGQTDEGCVTCQYMGQKYGNGDWSCPAGWRMPNQNEWDKVYPCVKDKESSYYHGTAYYVGGCNCKWNGNWCGQKSIHTFDQGILCGDYWGHHVCVPN